MTFIDTNYFVRFLENDHPIYSKITKDLFVHASESSEEFWSSVIVLFEIYWLQKKFYEKPLPEIQKSLVDLFSLSFITWENEAVLKKAVYSMDKFNFDLEDSYNYHFAKSKRITQFATFDKKLLSIWTKSQQITLSHA